MVALSVVVPIYNCEKFLEVSIKSILDQTFRDYELILVDDGSTDSSPIICDRIEQIDTRVRVIHKKNEGAGSARNVGIDMAISKYLMFPDADDFCHPDMFQIMMDEIVTSKADLVICSYETGSISNGQTKVTKGQQLFSRHVVGENECRNLWFEIRKLNICLLNSPCNKIYKKSIIDHYNLRFPDIRRAQDAVFNMHYYSHVTDIAVIGEILYLYNVNDVFRVAKKFQKSSYLSFIYFNRIMEEVVTSWGMYDGEKKMLCDNNLIGTIYQCMELCMNKVWKMKKKEQISYLNEILHEPYLIKRFGNYSGNVIDLECMIPYIKNSDSKGLRNAIICRNLKEKLREYPFIIVPYRYIKKFLNKRREY